jgi:hypothetical protein
MFPPGLPGLALLLLRASVAIALLVETYAHRHAIPVWIQVVATLISLTISVGYLTPIAAAVTLVSHASIGLALGDGVDGVAAAIVCSLDALALALLGPGAYSVDSRRFGRRLIVLPPP